MAVTNVLKKVNFHQAVAEVMLIAFGIICALAVQAWWDAKQDREAEFGYLLALQKDFMANRYDLDQNAKSISNVFVSIDAVFKILADDQSVQLPNSFSGLMGKAYFVYESSPITGTYDDMVNSGNLHLIGSESLRNSMAQFMTVLGQLQFYEETLMNSYWNLHAPFVNRHLVTSDFGWYGPNSDIDPEVSELVGPAPNSVHSIDVDAVRSREFWNLVFSWKAAYSDQLNLVILARNHCDEILTLLTKEISKHSNN